MKNTKRTSAKVAELASSTLTDPNASDIQKTLAGSVLSQARTGKQTGAELEDIASKVLKSPKYNDVTKALAGSVLSQSNKKR